jgi:hypothetical protein
VLSGVIAGASVIVGGVLGAVIVSVNFVMPVVGHHDGYEAGPIEVFQYSPVAGVIHVVILVGGPAVGAWLGWLIARRIMR